MNKLFLFGLLALLIISVSSLSCSEYSMFGNDLDDDDCLMLTPTTGTHCCLLKNDGNKINCTEVGDDEYENIGRYIKYLNDRDGADYDIDCSSKFISLSLFAILALLF